MLLALLYFVRSGHIDINDGRLWYAGISGYYWSLSAASKHADGSATPSAYGLYFNAGGVYPSNGPHNRWNAFPLRCLVRGEERQANDHMDRLMGKRYLDQH